MHSVGCLKPGLIALGTATILLTGCARAVSDHAACPPVVEYSASVQQQVAAEVEALPTGAALEGFMADYHVLRQQARMCRTGTSK